MKRKLFIDTGHSSKYPGAVGEVEWVRKIAEKLYPLLNSNYWDVVKVPDSFPGENSANSSLTKRIKWINDNGDANDFLLSIHANSAASQAVSGVETCYYSGSDESKKEALRLSKAYSTATGVPLFNDGLMGDADGRYGRLGMIRDTQPFALLIECGFVTNIKDMGIDPTNAAKGIANYLNSLSNMSETNTQPISTFTPEQIEALKFDVDNKFTKITEPSILLEEGNRIDQIVARYRYHKKLKDVLASLGIYLTF